MRLGELAAALPGSLLQGDAEFEVGRIVYDSRRVRPHDLFVAIPGARVDGHDFAAAAAARGAALALERPLALPAGTPRILLQSARSGLGELAAALHGYPARKLRTVGVTGTDGKTTVTHMAAHLLGTLGVLSGFLSTVALRCRPAGQAANRSGLTTMEGSDLQDRLAEMVESGLAVAVVETTSHALIQGRADACEFDVAAFTNVRRDHLDAHGTWEEYLRAKSWLIDLCAPSYLKGMPKTAVLNADDASFARLSRKPIERRLCYSMEAPADVTGAGFEPRPGGSAFRLRVAGEEAPVRLAMPGRFNAANALCAAAICAALGPFDAGQLAAGLTSFPGVPGRLERVDRGQPFRVYLDFAHSASGLAAVLRELRPEAAGARLLLVFGATGRADHDRPGMGRAAAAGSDWFVITTDDPGDADPAELARAVEAGVPPEAAGHNHRVELDRRAAIRLALSQARPGDLVLLAGKGHERTMLLAAGPQPWDERAEAQAALKELGFG